MVVMTSLMRPSTTKGSSASSRVSTCTVDAPRVSANARPLRSVRGVHTPSAARPRQLSRRAVLPRDGVHATVRSRQRRAPYLSVPSFRELKPTLPQAILIGYMGIHPHPGHDAVPRARSGMPGPDDPHWYRDAILYELHVKAFFDSNDDGIGDFRGLVEKLDYLQDLGVTALWLLPTYPSPLRDDGYDIADYMSIQPSYGSLDDFEALVEAAHNRGLRVITELVMNHTSDQHPWFQASRSDPASPYRDYYVWSDNDEQFK